MIEPKIETESGTAKPASDAAAASVQEKARDLVFTQYTPTPR